MSPTITFITLAIKHNKIKHNKIRCFILCEINENCIKRINNNWKDFSDNGEDFTDENHNYSKDLDIFGENSLFQWINTCITYLGRQKLKDALSAPIYNIEEIHKRQEAIKELAEILDGHKDLKRKQYLVKIKIITLMHYLNG